MIRERKYKKVEKVKKKIQKRAKGSTKMVEKE
jgi:hypothetical protein